MGIGVSSSNNWKAMPTSPNSFSIALAQCFVPSCLSKSYAFFRVLGIQIPKFIPPLFVLEVSLEIISRRFRSTYFTQYDFLKGPENHKPILPLRYKFSTYKTLRKKASSSTRTGLRVRGSRSTQVQGSEARRQFAIIQE